MALGSSTNGTNPPFAGVFGGSFKALGSGSGSLNGTIFAPLFALLAAFLVADFAGPRCFSDAPFIFSAARTFSLILSFRVPSSGHAFPDAASAASPLGSTKIATLPLGREDEDERELDADGPEKTSSCKDAGDSAVRRELDADVIDEEDAVDLDSPRTVRLKPDEFEVLEVVSNGSGNGFTSPAGAATIIRF